MAISSGTGNHQEQHAHGNSDPGIYWTTEEQATLEDLLTKYASISNIRLRYLAIASALNDKTVRDVALRVRWMNEWVSDPAEISSQFSARPNVPPYAPPMIPIDNYNSNPYAASGGPTAELIVQNTRAMSQISANLSSRQIYENLDLLCRTRDNINMIRIITNKMNDSSEVLKKLPSRPWKVNEELANSILPLPRHQPQ